MSYSIEYDPEKNRIYPLPAARKLKWLPVLLAVLIALFTLQKLDKSQRLKALLLPGDPEITADALSSMVDDVRGGEPVGEALTAFCLEIIQNG